MSWIYILSSFKIVWTFWLVLQCIFFPKTESYLLIILVILIVISDIFDGRIASLFGFNNAKRRLFDNATDVFITHLSYISIIYFLGWSAYWYVPLFFRDAIMVLMGIKTTKNKIVIFPGIIHKLARLFLPMSTISMLANFYGEIFLIIALIIFFIALIDYYGYFIIMCNKLRKGEVLFSAEKLGEIHLNSSFNGIKILIPKQKLLPP